MAAYLHMNILEAFNSGFHIPKDGRGALIEQDSIALCNKPFLKAIDDCLAHSIRLYNMIEQKGLLVCFMLT